MYISSSEPSLQNVWNSICSNSIVLNIKFPGVISFLNALPIWAILNGSLALVDLWTFKKLTYSPCAFSGLKYMVLLLSFVTPLYVWNIKLNCLISVKLHLPHFGHGILFSLIYASISSCVIPSACASGLKSLIKLSALCLVLHSLQSNSGSEKPATCPLASHTLGCISMSASIS